MRRIAGHLFTYASALSLLLCVATCVLWVRSYRAATVVDGMRNADVLGGGGMDDFSSHSAKGGIIILYFRNTSGKSFQVPGHAYDFDYFFPESERRIVGFWWEEGRVPDYLHVTYAALVVPYWFVLLCLLLIPLARLFSLLRGIRRRRTDRCVRCGYDLRASPERCPECGTANPRGATREVAGSS